MGREAGCTIRWQGEAAEGKVLLEAGELILRGDIRARFARPEIARTEVQDGCLRLWLPGGVLELDLGAEVARRWQAAILKAPPDLATKLGLGPGVLAHALAPVADPALAGALEGRLAPVGEASVLIAELADEAALAAAVGAALAHPAKPVWCVYPKGRGALPSDAAVRTAFRAAGFIDTKSCAISAAMTATRYGLRR